MKRAGTRRTRGSGSLFKRNGKYVYQWLTPDGQKKSRMLIDKLGNAITVYSVAVDAAEELIKDQSAAQRLSSKIEYLHEIAETKKFLPVNKVSVASAK